MHSIHILIFAILSALSLPTTNGRQGLSHNSEFGKVSSFDKDEENTIHIGCGGLIEVDREGQNSTLVHFKSKNISDAQERCLWTIDSNEVTANHFIRLKMTILYNDFKTDDSFLTVIEWKSGSIKDFVTHVINTTDSVEYIFPQEEETFMARAFLSLNSKGHSPQSGFSIRFEAISSFYFGVGTNSAFTTSPGRALYTFPAFYNDVSSILISPEGVQNMSLQVTVSSSGDSNPCVAHDSVDVLEVGPEGIPSLLGRLCGHQSTVNYTTEYPVLAFFYWYSRRTGDGVTLIWN